VDGDKIICTPGGSKGAIAALDKMIHLKKVSAVEPEDQARQFFAAYSQALEKKHSKRSDESKQRDFYKFTTADGGVFLRCVGRNCVMLEGGERALFAALTKELGWEAPAETAKELRQDAAAPSLVGN